jgi:hypothetical protein
LNALRHEKTYEQKFETQAARRAESLHHTVDSLTLSKTTGQEANPLVRRMCRWQNFAAMKVAAIFCAISFLALWTASAETPVPQEGKSAESAQLEALAKKLDEQNAKIDALSLEIL